MKFTKLSEVFEWAYGEEPDPEMTVGECYDSVMNSILEMAKQNYIQSVKLWEYEAIADISRAARELIEKVENTESMEELRRLNDD